MVKNKKIKFEDLEQVGAPVSKEVFEERGLLEILSDEDKLKSTLKDKRMSFLTALFERLSASSEFRINAMKLIEKRQGAF